MYGKVSLDSVMVQTSVVVLGGGGVTRSEKRRVCEARPSLPLPPPVCTIVKYIMYMTPSGHKKV